MEYLLDCFKVLYPYFYYVFIFDHLCGNEWAREVGIKASIMRKYFCGKQTNMRDTVMLWGVDFSDHVIVFWKQVIPITHGGTQPLHIVN